MIMSLASVSVSATIHAEENIVMKVHKFKIGDIICSPCGDRGIILAIGSRPDKDFMKLGVYAHWTKEGIAFWMDLDEPQLQLCNDLKKEEPYEC